MYVDTFTMCMLTEEPMKSSHNSSSHKQFHRKYNQLLKSYNKNGNVL